jgi:hypothetical protein
MVETPETINPFESPRVAPEAPLKTQDFRTSRIGAATTRIVVFPFGNVLGMLEICATFALSGAVASMSLMASAFLGPPVIVGVMAFDIWWRTGQPERAWWARLLSPYAGGCFGFIPVWIFFPAFLLFVIALALVPNPWVTR